MLGRIYLLDLILAPFQCRCVTPTYNNTQQDSQRCHMEFLASQTDNKWGRNFLTHVNTFHNLCATLTTNGNDILTTMKTNGENTLTNPMTDGEDTLTTLFTTHNYLVTTPHEVTDDPCDNIDDLYGIHCLHDWDQVMTRTTRWWQGRLPTPTDDMANLVWWPMWLLLATCNDRSDDQNTTLPTLTTTGDSLLCSMWQSVDDPGNFLTTSDDSIWQYYDQSWKLPVLQASFQKWRLGYESKTYPLEDA